MVIIWTDYAIAHLKDIFDSYLLKSESAAIKIHQEILSSVKPLKDFPEMAQREQLLAQKETVYRSLVILKHFKVIYSVSKYNIYIVDVWDCRQSPKTNVKKIKE